MKKIGLFYSKQGENTTTIADKIQKLFGKKADIEVVDVDTAWDKDFQKYDNLLIGTSTWLDGELPTYWDELVPQLKTLKLNGKKVAIFGLGDQKAYPDTFVDAIGLIASVFEEIGAKVVGRTSTEGYTFEKSVSICDNMFLGLAIDNNNEADKTDERLKKWVTQLEKEFN